MPDDMKAVPAQGAGQRENVLSQDLEAIGLGARRLARQM